MIQSLKDKMQGLIDAYLRAKQSGELEEETSYGDKIEAIRKWQRENILDLNKLKNYSDEEFAEKFGEMFDHTDGSVSMHNLAKMRFSKIEKRLAVRNQFENLVGYITSHENDRFELLEEILNPTSPYKVSGLGSHIATTLINSEYPDVPPINETTKEFFRNIDEPLPLNITEQQREVNRFFAEMNDLNNELTLDDINHICWYSKTIPSGREFMKANFPATFKSEEHPRRTTRRKRMTREEQMAARLAELQAINRSANQ